MRKTSVSMGGVPV